MIKHGVPLLLINYIRKLNFTQTIDYNKPPTESDGRLKGAADRHFAEYVT